MIEGRELLAALFWISVLGLIYLFVGYPLVLWAVAKLRPRPIEKADITPSVSIVIAAYNEEKVIQDRIRNCLALHYPKDRMEIIASSDGSTNGTNRLVSAFRDKRVRLIASPQRNGKLSALNRAVRQANGEILVFTDANSQFRPDALTVLVRSFQDRTVGCVAGRKVITDSHTTETSGGESLYWKYENFIKQTETLIHSTMGADGSIYAIRKELYQYPDETVGYSDDYVISLGVICQGYRLVYEESAVAYEEASDSLRSEFKRKIRTLSGGLESVRTLNHLLIPLLSPVWWQLWSHRVLRFGIPYLLLSTLICSALLSGESPLYAASLLAQLVLYSAAVGSLLGVRHRIATLAFRVTFMNLVFVPALLRFLFGKTETRWEKIGR